MHRLFLLSLLTILSYTHTYAEKTVTRTQMHMGTLVSISLPESDYVHIQKGFELVHEIEMALSSYAPQAEVYRLNHGEAVSASAYTREAIALSQRYYRETNGYFNITIGSITKKAFHFGEAAETVPADDQLDNAIIDMDGITVHESVIELQKGITLDLGGMGKGYAVDKVARQYRENNITQGIIAASGDIRCLDTCSMQIQHPFQEGIMASFTTSLPDIGISTSGNYRRYVKDKQNNHLIDPKKKRSQKRFASITLIAQLPNSDLDAYATAASVMPMEQTIAFLNAHDIGYILVNNDRSVIISEDLERIVKDLRVDLR